eukprot:35866_1
MCDCFGSDSDKPEVTAAVETVNDEINATDSFATSMLAAELQKAINTRDYPVGPSMIVFPPPYEVDPQSKVDLNCVTGSGRVSDRFQIPRMDEYLGDFGFFDDVCHYGKYSDGFFGNSFEDNGDPPSKLDFSDLSLNKDPETEARHYFQGTIANPLYRIDDINRLQRNEKDEMADGNELLHNKLLNDWEEVGINILKGQNQVLSSLLSDSFESKDKENLWMTLIAFTGYGAHRTSPIASTDDHPGAFFVNDVTFLSQYSVRKGFELYGAAAYFDKTYQLIEIALSHTPDTTYRNPDTPDSRTSQAQWKHARWAWKVSVSVAVFLVDNLCHARFRESNALVTAMQRYLPIDHALHRLLLPFTLGTVNANRVYNEFLRENGLYHRCFAFKYKELQRLIRESMDEAPERKKGEPRELKDKMKYRFRLLSKQVSVMKKLPDTVYPVHSDIRNFWTLTLAFVEEYIDVLYNATPDNDVELQADGEAKAFYYALCDAVGIGRDRYRFKKFNIINILNDFICKASAWAHHLNMAVSFEYSMDLDFTGVKIIGNNAMQNNVSSYVEYCLLVLSTGWKQNNLIGHDVDWSVVLNQDDPKFGKMKEAFDKYFGTQLKNQSDALKSHNRDRLAPYKA